MNTKIVNSVLFILCIAQATMQRAAKLLPEAMKLTNPETKADEFVVVAGNGKGQGSLSAYGATFGAPAANGAACIQIQLPDMDPDKRKAYVEDTYGSALLKLKDVSEQVIEALEDRGEAIAQLLESMEVQ